MSRKTRILAKSKHGVETIMQYTDFIVSSGDDKQIRIWKIPPPLKQKAIEQMIANGEMAQSEEYCILNTETGHEESITCVQYLHESMVSVSSDMLVKIYHIDIDFVKKNV